MANVSEDSLKSGGFSPNLYVKNILLEKGSSIDLRGAPANSGEQFVEFRGNDGTIRYSSASRSNNAGDGSINVTLNIQVKDVIDNDTGQGFWLQDYNGRANSVIYIFQSTNSSLTNFLISENFFDSPTAQMPSDYKKLIDYDTKQISLSISDTEHGIVTGKLELVL